MSEKVNIYDSEIFDLIVEDKKYKNFINLLKDDRKNAKS